MTDQLRIVLAHGSDQTLQHIRSSLHEGRAVSTVCGTVAELVNAVRHDRPDLIVTGVAFPDGDGIEACIELGRERPIPAVIVTTRRSLDLVTKAMQDHVMAYLLEPVKSEELQAAIVLAWSRFQQLRQLESEVGDLRRALASRKIIERAKGILMAERSYSEAEAFDHIRRESQNRRVSMAEIAQSILDQAQDGRANSGNTDT